MTEVTVAEEWGVQAGYHDVFGRWHAASPETITRLVKALSADRMAPARHDSTFLDHSEAFQGDRKRVWGIAVQLYAVRSARNWGIGDFGDLRDILEIAAQSGASAVGLNPLHALFLDDPGKISPYAPNSRLFLNPLYIDVTGVPEFPAEAAAELAPEIERLRAAEFVDYHGVADLKLRALRTAYDQFLRTPDDARAEAFAGFRRRQGEKLLRFSCFEVLRRRYAGASWREWPSPFSRPDLPTLETFRRDNDAECGYFEYLQWVADAQIERCSETARASGMSIGLYLDLAVGVDPDGADAWSNQAAVLSDFSVGAPPDEFNPAGQDWGLAPFNPNAIADDDFRVVRDLLGATMRHAGAVRLDHVLGLMRLFLVPRGGHAADGVYVSFPFEQLLRVIAQESARHRCIFIGEDLGTVPDGFRETAARWGVWSYRVMMFERWHDGRFSPPAHYPAQSLATFNTHDLATFRGWMSGHDLEVKHAIGVDPGEDEDAREQSRTALRYALLGGDDFPAVAGYLAQTPSRLVMVGIEDLLGVEDQINVPSTVNEHPNWRRKLPVSIGDWPRQPLWRRTADVFREWGRS
jgi:4-alpha-glucanotransferase